MFFRPFGQYLQDMTISLNGFMGSGKSCVARKLSERLGCALVDLDHYIEEKTGRKIPEIFASDGESGFRKTEKEALEEVLESFSGIDEGSESGNVLLSLGGGTVTTPECAAMVRERTFCIYLRASVDTLVKNLQNDFASRPMLGKNGGQPSDLAALRSRVEELMSARSSIYESCASLVIDTDSLSFDEITGLIAAKLSV